MTRALAPLTELQSRLQQIATANGYRTEAGSSVFLGRTMVGADEAPAITITQDDEQDAEVAVNASLVRKTIPYIVEGIIAADPSNPYTEGFRLLADMDQAIFSAGVIADERLAGTAVDVQYTGSQVQQAEDGSAHCIARVSLAITHSEKLGDPSEAS